MNMLGILILTTLSLLLLRLTGNHRPLAGYLPDRLTAMDLCFGIGFPILYYYSFELLLSWLVSNPYRPNPAYGWQDALHTLAYISRSVIYEELIFRGALLWLLCKKLGPYRAAMISSICFGIYHWFAWQALGNTAQMAIIFLTTGSVGLLYAYSFVRLHSMYLPIAMHLGGNIATMLLFSKDQSIGPQLFLKSYDTDPHVPHAIIGIPMVILHFCGYQLLTFIAVRRYMRFRQSIIAESQLKLPPTSKSNRQA